MTLLLFHIPQLKPDIVHSQRVGQKPWTYMIYADADNADAIGTTGTVVDALLARGVSSSENISIVVLQDFINDPATLWSIDEDHNATLLENLGEINMANYTTLRDFINYCKNNFSAERYMINLWDHGGAWMGACWDYTNNNDHLTMDEIQKALNESGGVNIIGFTACDMGCIEAAYELRNYTDVYIGSEEAYGYSEEWTDIIKFIDENPKESTYNISEKIINSFKEYFPYFGNTLQWKLVLQTIIHLDLPYFPSLTLSAVRTDKLEVLVSSIDTFAHVLIKDISLYKPTITRERFKVDNYPYPSKLIPPSLIFGDYIDIYHFTELMDKPIFRLLKPELHDAAQQVQEHLEQAIIAEHHQIGHRNAHGLTIYFPLFYQYYSSEYTNSSLDFTHDTQWDEFLDAYRSSK
ncbi:MAG: clostripain-related cysteine peptidase [Euryarchaeota archaeon]|nr:clostripain-related cysteine peptidase [Euryarchaeota archaeon]